MKELNHTPGMMEKIERLAHEDKSKRTINTIMKTRHYSTIKLEDIKRHLGPRLGYSYRLTCSSSSVMHSLVYKFWISKSEAGK